MGIIARRDLRKPMCESEMTSVNSNAMKIGLIVCMNRFELCTIAYSIP